MDLEKLKAADWPVPIRCRELEGRLVRLEPLRPEHEGELAAITADPAIWEFTTSYAKTPEALHAYLDKELAAWRAGTAVPFAARELASGAAVGFTRLKNLDRAHRRGTIGSWYAPRAWGRGVNLEAKLLLLGLAFDGLGCLRVEFHADSRNQRSRDSLLKLGAREEGVLRLYQITRAGERRDSVVYSIVAEEWARVREGIEERLTRAATASPG